MRKIIFAAALAALLSGIACGRVKKNAAPEQVDFVTVRDGNFYIGDSVYRFVGTNFWYGPILASEGRGGDRERLARELDLLQANGIDNLRVLVGGDGDEGLPSHIGPVLQTAPGVYNDTLLAGLDYFMAELERRGMKAVLYLNNAWEWSGGYSAYLQWAGEGKAPIPSVDGWPAYMDFVKKFVHSDSAKTLAANHVRNIVTRVNTVTGKPYSESPALMAWQVANEPRAFADDSLTKRAFADWVLSTARLIKELDPNHLVSTGSEGKHGCEQDIELWNEIHSAPEIDYGIVHLWPYNWSWVNASTIQSGVDSACIKAVEYIRPHADLMKTAGKPLVLEEFGYPRDSMSFTPGSPVTGRDRFYEYVFTLVSQGDLIDGCNFWGWGGVAGPANIVWQPGDDYVCDPAQEEQGLNSVFVKDNTTLEIISRIARNIKQLARRSDVTLHQ